MSTASHTFCLLPLLFLAACSGAGVHIAAPTAPSPQSHVDLRQIHEFALGGVGYAGIMSRGEQALRTYIATAPNGESVLGKFEGATPEGRLYLLVALREVDRGLFDERIKNYVHSTQEVSVARGCCVGKERLGDVALQIRDGKLRFHRDWKR